jgi:hypothetical protein
LQTSTDHLSANVVGNALLITNREAAVAVDSDD